MTHDRQMQLAGGWEAVLLAAGRDANSIPAALAEAAKQGKVGGCLTTQLGLSCTQALRNCKVCKMAHLAPSQISADIIQRYLKFENNPLFRQLMKIPGELLRTLAQYLVCRAFGRAAACSVALNCHALQGSGTGCWQTKASSSKSASSWASAWCASWQPRKRSGALRSSVKSTLFLPT
jgi:hypothetical protein